MILSRKVKASQTSTRSNDQSNEDLDAEPELRTAQNSKEEKDALGVAAQAGLLGCYVLIWVTYTLLISSSRTEYGEYAYNPLSVILFSEIAKLIVSTIALALKHSSHQDSLSVEPSMLGTDLEKNDHGKVTEGVGAMFMQRVAVTCPGLVSVVESWEVGKYFAVPAMIYAVYNMLSYVNLKLFSPVEFKVLINIRILLTGVTLHWGFGRTLASRQWIALLFLMLGCTLTQLTPDFHWKFEPFHLATMLVQSFLSSLGGVYSEILLQKNISLSIHVKNSYLYIFSILFNLVWISIAEPEMLASWAALTRGFNAHIVLLVAVSTSAGLFTAVFLRYLGVIVKEYAHSLEIFSTAIFSWLVLGAPLSLQIVVSMVLVCVSVYIYNRQSK